MKALAAKSPLNDTSSKSAVLKHRHTPGPKSVPVAAGTNAFIQNKSLCPCDGGCPRCSGIIQPKLTIGQPNDIYEQEADRVADQIMRMPEPGGSSVNGPLSLVQRQADSEEEEEEPVQTKPIGDQITPLIQRQEDTGPEEGEEDEEPAQAKSINNKSPPMTAGLHSQIQSMKGSGQPLSQTTRTFFEPRFGRDFSNVRIHTGAKAAETVKSINAKAFTMGKDVVFGAGQYSPETTPGKRLLAHELVHVVQQYMSTERLQRKAASRWGRDTVGTLMSVEVQKAARGKPTYYIHNAGQNDTLSKLVEKYYGLGYKSKWLWPGLLRIFKFNRKKNTDFGKYLKNIKSKQLWKIRNKSITTGWKVYIPYSPQKKLYSKYVQGCYVRWPVYVHDYASDKNKLGLDGAASCLSKYRRKKAVVTLKGKTVNVLCADTMVPLSKQTSCKHEIELSPPAWNKLIGNRKRYGCRIKGLSISYAGQAGNLIFVRAEAFGISSKINAWKRCTQKTPGLDDCSTQGCKGHPEFSQKNRTRLVAEWKSWPIV